MGPWAVLIPIAVVAFAGSWLSYRPEYKGCWWFPWSMAALAVAAGLLWAWVCRLCGEDQREQLRVSVAWDVLVVLAYTVLPLVAFGVRLSPAGWVGVVLVIVGTCLVKWG